MTLTGSNVPALQGFTGGISYTSPTSCSQISAATIRATYTSVDNAGAVYRVITTPTGLAEASLIPIPLAGNTT